jgi:hypothetical protein
MSSKNVEVSIARTPSFLEVWYEGSVVLDKEEYKFWLIDPQTPDPSGNHYEVEVRWFFKNVPMQIRAMAGDIANQYIEMIEKQKKEND